MAKTAARLRFWKMEGTGNDFIFLHQEPRNSPAKLKRTIAELCRPHTGIGADGLVYVWKKPSGWRWRYFNADGSEAGLCGNAARCMGLWLHLNVSSKTKEWSWRGVGGEFTARMSSRGQPEVSWPMKDVRFFDLPDELMNLLSGYNDRGFAGLYWLNVGVPHLVVLNHEHWDVTDRHSASALLRSHPLLGPEGANVTWLSLAGSEVVTFERGVEADTMACGSGAAAAFMALKARGEVQNDSASFRFPGGELKIRLEDNKGEQRLWLSGPTRLVYEGELHE